MLNNESVTESENESSRLLPAIVNQNLELQHDGAQEQSELDIGNSVTESESEISLLLPPTISQNRELENECSDVSTDFKSKWRRPSW